MNSENIVKNLRVLWRTDRIIADIRMRHMLVGLGLRAFAALIAAFGLLMLELSAYFALVQIWSAISAAAILGAPISRSQPPCSWLRGTAARRPRTRACARNPRLGGRGTAGRGPRAAVAVLRHGPPSAQRRAAVAARAADHDHRQEPEEIQATAPAARPRPNRVITTLTQQDKESYEMSKTTAKTQQADPERFPAGAIPATPHRAGPRTRPSRGRSRGGLYHRRAARCRRPHRCSALARASRGLPGRAPAPGPAGQAWPPRSPARRRLGFPL